MKRTLSLVAVAGLTLLSTGAIFAHHSARMFDTAAPVTIKGQTWHRVVVRDGASERNRLASDGVRGFWPITL